MVEFVVLAAALYVCPGNVYSDVPREGCKPYESNKREGFTTLQEAPAGQGAGAGPSEPIAGGEGGQVPGNRSGGSTPEMCALYKEYVALELKTQGGFKAESTDEIDRWQTLKRMFQNAAVPDCP